MLQERTGAGMMRATVLDNSVDTTPLDEELLDVNGRMRLLPAEHFKKWPHATLQLWCMRRARYGVPTTELVEFLREHIGSDALEIGAGNGDLGRHLGIRMTDSAFQTLPDTRLFYELTGQPIIDPPADVERIEGLAAVKKYKPKVVVASWTTQLFKEGDQHAANRIGSSIGGVDELELLRLVDCYFHIGNAGVHRQKRALALKHREVKAPWLVSRSPVPEDNVIYIWER